MPLAEDAATRVDHYDPQGLSIVEPQCQSNVNPFGGIDGSVEIDRAFDPEEAGYRQAGTLHHALIPADFVRNPVQSMRPTDQFSEAGDFFYEF